MFGKICIYVSIFRSVSEPRYHRAILCVGRCFFCEQADTTADRKDKELLQDTLKSLAGRLGYRLVMSLANYKYAGTAALIRRGKRSRPHLLIKIDSLIH